MAGLSADMLHALMVTHWEEWAPKAALEANTELTMDMVQMDGLLGSRDPRGNLLMTPPTMGVLQMVKHLAELILKMLLDKVLVQTEDTWPSQTLNLTPQTQKVP